MEVKVENMCEDREGETGVWCVGSRTWTTDRRVQCRTHVTLVGLLWAEEVKDGDLSFVDGDVPFGRQNFHLIFTHTHTYMFIFHDVSQNAIDTQLITPRLYFSCKL